MAVFRVGPLPDAALEAAAEFHARVVPEVLALVPPQNGEGDHAKHGGGAPAGGPDLATSGSPPVPLHHPPHSGEDIALIFTPAPYDHRGWRLAAVQDLSRAAAPRRVNGIVGDDEAALAETLAWLDSAPGVTGQLFAVEPA